MSGNNEGSTPEFDEFLASGEVEVGSSNLASQEEPAKKAAPRRGAPKPAAEQVVDQPAEDDADEPETDETDGADDADEPETDEIDEGDEDQDEKSKEKRKPSDRIRELTRKIRERDRLLEAALAQLQPGEKGLQPQNSDASQDAGTPEPDPSDIQKYPLGHLDDRYIEDKLEWLAEKKAAERADAVLQRQQESEQQATAQRQQQELLVKVDDLATRGSDIYDDFQETVVEAGMRGEWDLSQPTFEAAHEADNGAQILYELSQDKAEATRVAKLSPYQQLKFVQERDAEIGKSKTARKIPKAGEPPKNTARGANSRTQINPATDNLDDFEKAWEADAKRGMR